MPYASDKQRGFMHAKHPGIAARWDKEEHPNRAKEAAAAGGAAAVGGGGLAAGTLIPVKASKMKPGEAAVHAKLRAEHESHLTPHEFSQASGGRGGRAQNNAYTARLAEAKRAGKVPQGQTTLQVWNNTVTGLDGAHRGHASAMLGDNVHVQTVQHNRDKTYRGLLQRSIKERKIGRQRKRVAQHANMGDEGIARLSGTYKPKVSDALNRWKSVSEHSMSGKVGPGAAIAGVAAASALGGKKIYDKKVAKGMRLSEIAKAMTPQQKQDTKRGVAGGVGATALGAGLVGGGIPGSRPDVDALHRLAENRSHDVAGDVRNASKGGILGYRTEAHRRLIPTWERDRNPHVNHFDRHKRGLEEGKIWPEKKIVGHLKRGRLAANTLTVAGGATLAGLAVTHQKRKSTTNFNNRVDERIKAVGKADDEKNHRAARTGLVAGGAATSAGAYGLARGLEHQGKQWNKRAMHEYHAAEKINPLLGGAKETKSKISGKVPYVRPEVTREAIEHDWGNKLMPHSVEHAQEAGLHRGAAGQARYFASTYGSTAKKIRRFGVPAGGALAATGGTAMGIKAIRNRREKMSKSLVMKSESAGHGTVQKARAILGGTNVTGYGYSNLPENIRNDVDSGSISARRNPMSALDIYAASRIMADASTGGRLSKRRLGRRAQREYNYAGGRAMLYSPTGRGAIF